MGYRWKRCLNARHDPDAVTTMHAHLRGLHVTEARDELAVVYIDEYRFSRQAPVPYAQQVRGVPPVPRPAGREAGEQSVPGC